MLGSTGPAPESRKPRGLLSARRRYVLPVNEFANRPESVASLLDGAFQAARSKAPLRFKCTQAPFFSPIECTAASASTNTRSAARLRSRFGIPNRSSRDCAQMARTPNLAGLLRAEGHRQLLQGRGSRLSLPSSSTPESPPPELRALRRLRSLGPKKTTTRHTKSAMTTNYDSSTQSADIIADFPHRFLRVLFLTFCGSFCAHAQFVDGTYDHISTQTRQGTGSTAVFSTDGLLFSSARASYHAYAKATATVSAYGSGASGDAPFTNLPTNTFTLSVQGPGVVIVRGDAVGSTSAIGATIIPSLTQSIVHGGGSVTWNVGQGAQSRSWGIGSQITSFNYMPQSGSDFNANSASIVFPSGLRSFTITDSTQAQAKAYSTGQIATATAEVTSSGWTAAFVPGNTLEEARRAVLQGSVHAAPATNNPARIEASFTPGGGLTLQEAAILCGVDHFNWLQYVVDTPFTFRKSAIGSDPNAGTILNPPILDSDTDPSSRISLHSNYSNITRYVNVDPGAGDTAVFYLSEDPKDQFYVLQPEFYTANTLKFRDNPRTVFGDFAPGESLRFATSLVGVNADGSYVSYSDLLTNFIWSSDAEYIGDVLVGGGIGTDVVYLSTIDETGLPPVVSGGVFNVQIVPEPIAGALGLFGCLVIALARSRDGGGRKK
jgi:hypothetical protein